MDLYRINLNLLIALDTLLLEQNVTKAAKKLFITQAAMSNNLQQLRDIFKDELLVREKNHMELTYYAKELHPKLHQVLQEVRSLIVSGQRFAPETSQRVFKIGLPDYMAALILPELSMFLCQVAPHIKISVVSIYQLSSTESFERGEYDLGIGKIVEIAGSVQKQLLFKDQVVCILNRQHPLAKKKKITLKDYLSYKHVAIRSDNPNFQSVIEQVLTSIGQRREIQISLPYLVPMFQLIEKSTYLIGTVTNSMASYYCKTHRFVTKALPFKVEDIPFYLAWHKRYEDDLGHKWLREKIIEICRKEPFGST